MLVGAVCYLSLNESVSNLRSLWAVRVCQTELSWYLQPDRIYSDISTQTLEKMLVSRTVWCAFAQPAATADVVQSGGLNADWQICHQQLQHTA